MLTKKEIEVLTKIICINEKANRGGTTRKEAKTLFVSGSRIIEPIELNSKWEKMLEGGEIQPTKKSEENFSLKPFEFKLDINAPKIIIKALNPEQELKLIEKANKTKIVSYGFKAFEAGVVIEDSNKSIFIGFKDKHVSFRVKLPIINSKGIGVIKNSKYSFSYVMNEKGLVDPYTQILNFLVSNGGEDVSKEGFSKRVLCDKNNFSYFFNKMVKVFIQQEDSPVVLIPVTSKKSIKYYENNIFVNYQYDELVTKCKEKIKGLDLLTGSTSEPGKRVRLADNYIIEDCKIKKVKEGEPGDYLTEEKLISWQFMTSPKRQNSCTIKEHSEEKHEQQVLFDSEIIY